MDTWTALPPRKKKRGADAAMAALAASAPEQVVQTGATTSAQLYEKVIEDNVQARSVFHRADATLEGKDGCAGEFYECMFRISCSLFSAY